MPIQAEALDALVGFEPGEGVQMEAGRQERQARAARIAQHYESLLEEGESLAVVKWGMVTQLKDQLPPGIQDFLETKINRATDDADRIAARKAVLAATFYNRFGVQEVDFRFLPILDEAGEEQPDSMFIFPLAVVRNKRTLKAKLVR